MPCCLGTLRLCCGTWPSSVCFAATFPPGEGFCGKWYAIDLTYAVLYRTKTPATKLVACVSPLTYTHQSDALAVTAA